MWFGGDALYGSPLTQSMLGLRRALQRHLCVLHVHGRSHDGTVFSCGLSLKIPAFIQMKQRKILEVIISLRISKRLCCVFYNLSMNVSVLAMEKYMGPCVEVNGVTY